jgi:hypothetical protein
MSEGADTPRFPKSIELIDTGERRLPEVGEYYCFYHPYHEQAFGPNVINDDDVEAEALRNHKLWFGSPAHYAIYRKVERYE